MKRVQTTITLPSTEVRDIVKRAAFERGMSMSSLVRLSLAEYLNPPSATSADLPGALNGDNHPDR